MFQFGFPVRIAAAAAGLALIGAGLAVSSNIETAAAPAATVVIASDANNTDASDADSVIALAAVGAGTTNFEKQLLTEINKARATKQKCGGKKYPAVKPVKTNAKLTKAAKNHSSDMSVNDYFAHESNNGKTSPFTRIKAAGYRYKAAGETLAAGFNTPKSVVKAWLASPGHCKVIMGKAYTQVGLGYYSGDGKYRYYTTADFGKPA